MNKTIIYTVITGNYDTIKQPLVVEEGVLRLTYQNQYFEIDVYPFWQDKAIMEIELSNQDEKIEFPKEIKVIREVTDDDNYKNANLANL